MSNQQVVELNAETSVQILVQFVEIAQQKGAFILQEAAILKRAKDVALKKGVDEEINPQNAASLLIQGVNKGQKAGCYSLDDAAILNQVVASVVGQYSETTEPVQPSPVSASEPSLAKQEEADVDESIEELSAPIPLVPREI